MIDAELIAMGAAFYDIQRSYGATDRFAREQAVTYMRRKADEPGDALPYHDALSAHLDARTHERLQDARTALAFTVLA